MMCPSCEGPTRVLESRRADEGAAIRRRRQCRSCGKRFTTFERVEPARLYVRKRSGERQPFNREKLRRALSRAAHKRDVSSSQIDAIVDRVEAAARERDGELSAGAIGELCLAGLRELDWGAYLQFAGTLPSASPEFAASTPGGSVRGVGEDA